MLSRRRMMTTAVLALLFGHSAFAQDGQPSLADRRVIAAYRQDKWPAIEKSIQDAAGFAVPVEVDWTTLAAPGDAAYYNDDEYFGRTIFQPLAQALRGIARDDMGRDALREKLQRIRVVYDANTAPASNYPNGLSFENGVLAVNWRPFSNTAEYEPRVEALLQLLESKL